MEDIEDHLASTSFRITCPETSSHIKKLEISLDSRSNHYKTGDVVTGRLRFFNEKCVESKGVFIEVRGCYEVKMSTFKESKEYFNNGQCIYRPDNDTLQNDNYELPFSTSLPKDIPSTYHGVHGGVKYLLKVEVYGQVEVITSYEIELVLTARLNLNHEPRAKARGFQGIYPFQSGCCGSPGCLEVSIDLPKSGFVPSENISIDGFIHNKSTKEISTCELRLIERAVYNGVDGEDDEVGETRRVLKEDQVPGLSPHTSRQWERVLFEVPSNLPPTGLKYCDGIDLEYYLHFSFISKDQSEAFEVELPVIIGTVPIDLLPSTSLETSRYGALEKPPDYEAATSDGKTKRKKSKITKAADYIRRIGTPAKKLHDGTLTNEERVALLKSVSNNLIHTPGGAVLPEPNSLNPTSI